MVSYSICGQRTDGGVDFTGSSVGCCGLGAMESASGIAREPDQRPPPDVDRCHNGVFHTLATGVNGALGIFVVERAEIMSFSRRI